MVDKSGVIDLQRSCVNGSLPVVKDLINQGIKPEVGIIKSASFGRLEIVKYLISVNVDVNYTDKDGNFALERAAGHGHFDVVEALVRAGAEINRLSIASNYTPITHAVSHGYSKITEFLIKNGGDCSIKSAYGKTPISHAAYHGHLDLIKFLLKFENTEQQKVAFITAVSRNHKHIVEFFINQGIHAYELELNLNESNADIQGYIKQYLINKPKEISPKNLIHSLRLENVIHKVLLDEYGIFKATHNKDIFIIEQNYVGKEKGFKIAIENFNNNLRKYDSDIIDLSKFNDIKNKNLEFYTTSFNGQPSIEIKINENSVVTLINATTADLSAVHFFPETFLHDEL